MARLKLAPLLLLLVVGLVTACGGSDEGQASTPTPTSSIKIEDFAFSPDVATVRKGASIIVTNRDSTTHTLTADDGSFDTGRMTKGNKVINLDTAGTFSYHCEIHSYMKGRIVVRG